MTDIFTGALAAFAGPNLVIQYPHELSTGSDLDLRFWHCASSQALCVRLQAKRLNAGKKASLMVKAEHRAYEHLLHKPPKANFQYETLRDAPDPWIPLYMFYNHQSVTVDPVFLVSKPMVRGINLAFAHDVADELDKKVAGAAAKPRQIKHHKRLSHLKQHFFGIDAILCPTGDWEGEPVPSPEILRRSLVERFRRDDRPEKDGDVAHAVMRRIMAPGSLFSGSGAGERLRDGPSIRVRDRDVEMPTITFISGRTSDDRTPNIVDTLEAPER